MKTSPAKPPRAAAGPPGLPMIRTVEQHILEQQRNFPHATGEFSWLLSGITLATKIIQAQIQRAGLLEVIGQTGQVNVQGERVEKLDEIANKTLRHCLAYRGNVGILVSEEDQEPHVIQEAKEGKYIVLFDPLDGSSNINANVSIGTIFSILQRNPQAERDATMPQILQPGRQQVAAGYVVYGSSTVMAYTAGNGVHMFTLDPSIGAYVLAQENVRMPEAGRVYSVNEAYCANFPEGIQRYLQWAKESGDYSSRYIGSLVADFHRTLIRGGVFLYPGTKKSPQGKLRLLYEANPLAFVAEQAGGLATDGQQRILDKQPTAMHQRTPLIIGSKDEVERVLSF
jgi:fructose-1,6-bisphosphatase I